MENTIVSGNKRTFRAALFGVAMLIFGGAALAATAPAVAPLKFTYTVKDANGNTITLENKITTGYEANRVAVDKNGNVYVADAVSNTVSVFNTNGRLVRQISINKPLAIGVDKDDFKYVSGALNGGISIFGFDEDNNGKGTLGTGWDQPMDMAFASAKYRDISYADNVYDVYVPDASLNLVRRVTLNTAVNNNGEMTKEIIGSKDYGPYGGERYVSETWNYPSNASTYNMTRHRMVLTQGVAVNEATGILYVSVKEIVEYLTKTPQTTSVTCSKGDTSCTSGSDTNYIVDTESWKYYNDGNTGGSLSYSCPSSSSPCNPPTSNTSNTQIATDSTHIYWNPIDPARVPAAARYYILAIDMNTGGVVRNLGEGSSGYKPSALALDGKGRLYVASMNIGLATEIKVYDTTVNPEAALTVSGFAPGNYMTVAYSQDPADSTKGRLFAAVADSKNVSSYSIDGGVNPANTAPTAPVLLEPVSSNNAVAAVNTSTPTLRIRNSTDAENDPLTYAYEICSGSCTAPVPVKVAGAAGIAGGSNNETSMTITQGLVEDSLYHWRAQSFDGEKATWSDETTFCVDEVNSIPADPGVIYPKGEIVSSFSSSLSWTASTDSDCANDIVTYEVTVSNSQGNIVKTFSGLGATSISVSEIAGLISGNTYNWTVRAADNKGGNSGYSSGSFTYMTTSVTLDSDQAGTKVYIDGNYGYYGKLLGAVPVEKADILPGSHFVTFIKEGYEPNYTIIKVTDPVINAANSSVTYAAAMVAASRIKPPAAGVNLFEAAITGGYASPFVVDYNNDGFKDMIVGGGDGKVYIYQSELQAGGTRRLVLNAAIKADGVDIIVTSRAVPFVADYDNDGNQDLLIGSGDGTVSLYKGSAGGYVAAGTLGLKDSNGNDLKSVATNSAPAVVDYNNDGKKDLVIGSSDGTLRLYVNAGSDESPEFGLPVTIKTDGSDLNVGSDSKPFFTDWNSDGKKDLLVGDGTGKVSLFFNVGTDDAPSFVTISSLQNWIKGKKKERGNREFVPYLGYNQDLGDLTGGKFEASPFVVDWEGASARDVIVGNGSGGAAAYITE